MLTSASTSGVAGDPYHSAAAGASASLAASGAPDHGLVTQDSGASSAMIAAGTTATPEAPTTATAPAASPAIVDRAAGAGAAGIGGPGVGTVGAGAAADGWAGDGAAAEGAAVIGGAE